MFTGIVEDMGRVSSIKRSPHTMKLTIDSKKMTEDIHQGDSIAVNGVCLTVVSFTVNTFTVEVMPETVKATCIQDIQIGSLVNLERAMSANGRFGGHIVSGHIDATGKIIRKQSYQNAVYIDIELDEKVIKYCIPKGSIAIDGISLTIFEVKSNLITVSLIPHTYEHTVLGFKKVNELVNIENDLLGKYVIHQMERTPHRTGLTEGFLIENGF